MLARRFRGLAAAPLLAASLLSAAPEPASATSVPDPVGGAATAGLPLSRAIEVVLPAMGCARSREPPPVPRSQRDLAWKGRICDPATDFPATLQLVLAGPRGSEADDLERVQLRWSDEQGGPEAGKGRDDAEERARRLLTLFGVVDQEPVLAAFLARPGAHGRYPADTRSFDTPHLRVLVEVFGYERTGDEADHRLTISRPGGETPSRPASGRRAGTRR